MKKRFYYLPLALLALLALAMLTGCPEPESDNVNGTPISTETAKKLGEPQIVLTTAISDTVSDGDMPTLTLYFDTRNHYSFTKTYVDWGDGVICEDRTRQESGDWQSIQGKPVGNTVRIYSNDYITDFRCHDKLTSLDVSRCISLRRLNVSHNDLTSLNLFGKQSLSTLDCSFNALERLDVSDNPMLASLDCTANALKALTFGTKNTFLSEVNCSGNELEQLDLSRLSNLKVLDCSVNRLRLLYVGNNQRLRELHISSNTGSEREIHQSRTAGLVTEHRSHVPGLFQQRTQRRSEPLPQHGAQNRLLRIQPADAIGYFRQYRATSERG